MASVDDHTGSTFMYFLKHKSDASKALKKFLADSAQYGTVKKLRADNAGEYVSDEFEGILIENKISHQSSAPYSPHQNGTAERNWRTIFEMARTMLIGIQTAKEPMDLCSDGSSAHQEPHVQRKNPRHSISTSDRKETKYKQSPHVWIGLLCKCSHQEEIRCKK